MTLDETAPDFYSEEKATFGDRLTAAREAAGLTQGDLSEKLGIRLRTLRDWEDDMSEPRANRLIMLGGLLNVSLRWLLTGEGNDVAPAAGSPAVRPEEIAALRATLAEALVTLETLEARLRVGSETPALAEEARAEEVGSDG